MIMGGRKSMREWIARLVGAMLGVLFIGALTACADAAAAPDLAAPGPAQSSAFEYRLGPGDKLKIITYGEPTLTGEFSVSDAGKIAMPLAGDITASGLTPAELQAALEGALRKGFLKNPQVGVEVLTFRPFYVLGEVNKPGEYAYSAGMTVLNAVARANGFTYRADTKRVYIKRANEPDERRYPLTTTVTVQPGDTVRIGERYF